MDQERIGRFIAETRNQAGMTQKELALRTGYTPQYISNIICNKRCMSLESARLFSKVLGFREEYLLGIDNYKTNTDLFFNSSCSSTISFFDSAELLELSTVLSTGVDNLFGILAVGFKISKNPCFTHTFPVVKKLSSFLFSCCSSSALYTFIVT